MSEAIVQVQALTHSLSNSSENTMSKKIKLQDLSISIFDQKLDMPDIKGGKICIPWLMQRFTLFGLGFYWGTRCF